MDKLTKKFYEVEVGVPVSIDSLTDSELMKLVSMLRRQGHELAICFKFERGKDGSRKLRRYLVLREVGCGDVLRNEQA